MPDTNATKHAIHRASKELARLDVKLALAQAARDAAAAVLAEAQAAFDAPEPETRRYFTRAEIAAAQASAARR